MPERRPTFDVVFFGATSFVGQILAREALAQFGREGRLRWALAGRSREKLESVRASLGPDGADVDLLLADAGDEAALRTLCRKTRVVVSTVGPYALYGEPLVRVCAQEGTDYCDLTGEVQWIRRMLDRYEAPARASGARIVHCCGFDAIPSDLGVAHLQQAARERFGEPCVRVKMRVRSMRGGFSGGTAASILNLLAEAARDRALRRLLADPYALCPPATAARPRQPEVRFIEHDADFDAWVAPFVMSTLNTRIVHRTNALTRHAYGNDFRYDEAVLTGRGLRGRLTATGLAGALGTFAAAGLLAPTRSLLEKFVVPKPGEGPSPKEQERGGFDLRFVGHTADGRTLRTRVTGDRDPGYGATARMLAQAAACLAEDVPRQRGSGGFWTPAAIFGEVLIERLRANAGLTFDVLD